MYGRATELMRGLEGVREGDRDRGIVDDEGVGGCKRG